MRLVVRCLSAVPPLTGAPSTEEIMNKRNFTGNLHRSALEACEWIRIALLCVKKL